MMSVEKTVRIIEPKNSRAGPSVRYPNLEVASDTVPSQNKRRAQSHTKRDCRSMFCILGENVDVVMTGRPRKTSCNKIVTNVVKWLFARSSSSFALFDRCAALGR